MALNYPKIKPDRLKRGDDQHRLQKPDKRQNFENFRSPEVSEVRRIAANEERSVLRYVSDE